MTSRTLVCPNCLGKTKYQNFDLDWVPCAHCNETGEITLKKHDYPKKYKRPTIPEAFPIIPLMELGDVYKFNSREDVTLCLRLMPRYHNELKREKLYRVSPTYMRVMRVK